MLLVDEIKQDLTDYFSRVLDVCSVYLFGSCAKGAPREHSDVDIAVLFAAGLSSSERFQRRLEMLDELTGILKAKVDLVDLESAPLRLIRQIMLGKVLLIDKDLDRRVLFEVTRRRDYFDNVRFYEQYDKNAVKRIRGVES